MTHLREAMRTGIEKWDEELKKEKEMVRKAWIEAQRETLTRWLEDIEMALSFAKTTTTYIPIIREELVRAVQLKPSTTLGDPGYPPNRPNKPTDPTPARKHTAKKSGAGQQRTANKAASLEGDPQKGLGKQSQADDLGGRPGESVEEPDEDPKVPPGTKLKGPEPPGAKPKGPKQPSTKPKGSIPTGSTPPGTKPKGATRRGSIPKGVKPNEPVPQNTTPRDQSTQYKSDVVYDTK